MEKFNQLLVILLLVLVPALQSCDDDGYPIGDIGWDQATARAIGSGDYYLEGDRWGMIDLMTSSIPWYKSVDGGRVVALFNPLADTGKGAQMRVEGIQEVLTKEMEDMTAGDEEEFGNNPIVIYQGDMWLGGGFLNIIFHQYLPRSEKHRINPVQNKIEPRAPGISETLNVDEDGYIHLESCCNTYDGVTGYRGWGRASHNLEGFYLTAKDVAEIEFKRSKAIINSEENGEGRVIVLGLDHPVGVPEKAKGVHSTSFVR